jgi:hypothetical protein
MSFARLVPLMLVVAFGCRLPNPAFEDGEAGDSGDVFGDGSTDEAGSSMGESSPSGSSSIDGESDEQSASSDTLESSSDGFDTSSDGFESSSGSSSDGVDTSSDGSESMTGSSSDTFESSSEEMSSEEMSSDGLDAPDLMCPQVFPAEDCFTCMNNNCCTDLDVACFQGMDDKCHCTLQCLSNGGDGCGMECGADPLVEAHAQMIYQCGKSECPQLCI